jgi:hypothetical protein
VKRALAVVLLVACGSPEPAPASVVEAPPAMPVPPSTEIEIDPRDPYTMIEDMRAAERTAADAQLEAIASVRSSWEGHRFRWEMMRVQGLCLCADRCLFAPFDLARFDHPVDASFLPRVILDDAGFADLGERCAPHAATCVVTFEATLESFTFSIDEPTTLTLAHPTLVAARAIREGEHFLSRPPLTARGTIAPTLRRTLGVAE